ncbi:MAG: peroxiredoxin [Sulfitobacter sp.]
MAEANTPAPDFTLPVAGGAPDGGSEAGQTVTLSALKGAPVVLFFYPRDDTPGCTKENIAFSEHLEAFRAAGAHVFGISRDSLAKHDKFAVKHNLTVPLLADDGSAVEAYGVWVEKNMYGKKSMGIERATFVIDAEGRIAQVWRKVKVPGHAQAVLDAVRAL